MVPTDWGLDTPDRPVPPLAEMLRHDYAPETQIGVYVLFARRDLGLYGPPAPRDTEPTGQSVIHEGD